mmetsp:Transcript_5185/g.11258  ORF Transcript_5185/g.11258 Transcript_5185/m.11258 type:complete len:81 (+) Transcript_5185:152-394(+)
MPAKSHICASAHEGVCSMPAKKISTPYLIRAQNRMPAKKDQCPSSNKGANNGMKEYKFMYIMKKIKGHKHSCASACESVY